MTGGPLVDLSSRAITGAYFQALDAQMSWAQRVSWMNPNADQETETYKWLGQAPQMREWIGGRLLKQLAKHTYAITTRKFEASEPFDVQDLRRDKTGQIIIRIGDLARRTNTHWNKLVAELINTNPNAHDAVSFFNAARTIGDSGTINNELTNSEVAALNVADAGNKATETEMAAIILGIIEQMYAYKDDVGEPMNADATEFIVLTPPKQWGATVGAIRNERLDTGKSNTLANQEFSVSPVVVPRLTNVNQIIVCRVDVAAKPFILQEEMPPMVQVVGAGSEHEFKHDEHLFGVKALRAAGVGIPQFAARGTIS